MQKWRIERREFEYKRNGTLCLTANFNITTGKIIAPTIDETRTEKDFVQNIEWIIDSDLSKKW